MTRTLFEIGDDLRALAALMDECDAELTRETSEALDEWFAELAADEARKLDGYVGLIKQNEMEAKRVIRGRNERRLHGARRIVRMVRHESVRGR